MAAFEEKKFMMVIDSPIFVDTNILLCATDKDRGYHTTVVDFLEGGMSGRFSLITSNQVFREYLVVATRPREVNGFGLSPKDSLANVSHFQSICQTVDETSLSLEKLKILVQKHHLSGKRIHDANIAATMLANGLSHLMTLNPSDFEAFKFIRILNFEEI